MTQLHRNFQFTSLQVSNYSLAFYFCFTERVPSSARPLLLILLGTDTRPPTVISAASYILKFSFPSAQATDLIGLDGFSLRRCPNQQTALSIRSKKRLVFLASNLRIPWISVCVCVWDCTFVYLNSKTSRIKRSSFVSTFVCLTLQKYRLSR